MIKRIKISTNRKKQVVDLTHQINDVLEKSGKDEGICIIFVAHTTAAVTTGEIGEGTDQDLLEVIETIIPKINFRHAHDPSHAWSHMAASIAGASLTIPFENKKLILGTWQSVLLLEFDGPRERTIIVAINE